MHARSYLCCVESATLSAHAVFGLKQPSPEQRLSKLYRGLHLGGYDALKMQIAHYKQSTDLSWAERLVVAQTVSLLAGTVCYPIDSVRRRMMMQAGVPRNERLYRNSIHAMRVIAVDEGVRGFFLGIGPNLVRSIGAALLLVVYDGVKEIL